MNFIWILTLGWACISFSSAFAQTELAAIIGRDAGRPAENYQKYAKSLEITLKGFTAEQLADIFRGASPVGAGAGPSSPAYEKALQDFAAAQDAYESTEGALAEAQSTLQSVLADDAGLKQDGIPNNYGEAVEAAQADLATAQDNFDTALATRDELMAVVEEFKVDEEQ